MSAPQIPPQIQEQLMKLQQAQQNLQTIMAQKQQLEVEKVETGRALEELGKTADDGVVYKHAGSVMVRSTKAVLVSELEEKKELANTRSTVLQKQEDRVKQSLGEYETRINEMVKGAAGMGGAAGGQPAQDAQANA